MMMIEEVAAVILMASWPPLPHHYYQTPARAVVAMSEEDLSNFCSEVRVGSKPPSSPLLLVLTPLSSILFLKIEVEDPTSMDAWGGMSRQRGGSMQLSQNVSIQGTVKEGQYRYGWAMLWKVLIQ